MSGQLPIFNWSLKKLLATEQDTLNRAKIKIFFALLLLALAKICLVSGFAYYYNQGFQLGRALILLVIYLGLFKILLINARFVKALTHTMVCMGLFIVWSSIFISAQQINVVILQFAFMGMLSSFYLLDRYMGLLYSLLNILPIVIFMALPDSGQLSLGVEAELLASPGVQIVILLNFITVIIAHYLYHQAFSENVKEKEELNIKLVLAVEQANEHARAKSDFLSVMSHELRTPLNAVVGITDLLLDEPHEKEQDESLKILKFSAISLQTLINDILDFNKIDSNKIQLENISVNLHELVTNICNSLDIHAKERGLGLVVEIDEQLRTQKVMTDPTRISQVVYNLVGNGIKFTEKGYVKVTLKIENKLEDEATIYFAVEDSGIGISPEKHELIFEPFMQASSNITRNYGGTGLGLSIVKRLLQLFGSQIELESVEGKRLQVQLFYYHRAG